MTSPDDVVPSEAPVAGVASTPLSREALYELVWSEPMLKVAPRYGVSSSYLARICVLLNVPRPQPVRGQSFGDGAEGSVGHLGLECVPHGYGVGTAAPRRRSHPPASDDKDPRTELLRRLGVPASSGCHPESQDRHPGGRDRRKGSVSGNGALVARGRRSTSRDRDYS